jgi:hypothetical protein
MHRIFWSLYERFRSSVSCPILSFKTDAKVLHFKICLYVLACVRRNLAVSVERQVFGSAATRPKPLLGREILPWKTGMFTMPERQNNEASSYFGSAGKMYLHNQLDPRETTIIQIRDFHLVSHPVKSCSKH